MKAIKERFYILLYCIFIFASTLQKLYLRIICKWFINRLSIYILLAQSETADKGKDESSATGKSVYFDLLNCTECSVSVKMNKSLWKIRLE